jgi:hypothetical protein
MPRQLTNFGLPLLAKELIEQAARKRTYVIRVVYASLLFLVAFLFFDSSLLGPAAIIPFNEFDDLRELGEPFIAVLINFACYAVLLAVFRFTCLRNADRWLGRTSGETE